MAESKGSLITSDTLCCEDLENLLERRLRHAVLLDAKAALLMLKLAEKPSDSLVLLGHAQLEELSALLQKLYLGKVCTHPVDDLEARLLSVEPDKQVA